MISRVSFQFEKNIFFDWLEVGFCFGLMDLLDIATSVNH